MRTPQERFREKTKRIGECLEWQASTDNNGYGTFHYIDRDVKAHRMAWYFVYGEWPKQKLLHSCDNPPCVDISHLREGTHADNMADAAGKGRLRGLGQGGRGKLTPKDAESIREALRAGESQRSIAGRYRVSPRTIGKVKRREIHAN